MDQPRERQGGGDESTPPKLAFRICEPDHRVANAACRAAGRPNPRLARAVHASASNPDAEEVMAIVARVKDLLDREHAVYQVLPHADAFTAHDVAMMSRVPDRQMAKPVVLRQSGVGYVLAVLPACCRVDVPAFEASTGKRHLALASEEETARLFSDCEVGALPPFGNLYGMPVYVDRCFRSDGHLAFQAGNHHEVVRMPFRDFARLAPAETIEFCTHEREPPPAG